MIRTLIAGLTAVLLAAPLPAQQRTAPWHSDTSDVPADPGIVYGRLANGTRYAIRVNDTPKEQVVVRMRVEFGSAGEAANEQGLAHFIEHMAFNGTTNVPEGEMVKRLERLGLAFGAHTNAQTGYTTTTYSLDLPQPRAELIDAALFLMRETASEIAFDAKAVDAERGVVLDERRQRENFAFQSHRARDAFLYPGTYIAERYPIGTVDVLKSAPAERMKALYKKWYTPDRTTLVVVGPVDPAEIERKLIAAFGSWQATGAALGEIDRCTIDPGRPAKAVAFAHPEMVETVGLSQFWPAPKRTDSIATRRARRVEALASALINRRLQRAARATDAPFLSASVGAQDNVCEMARSSAIAVSAKDGRWREALTAVERDVRATALFGVSQAELDEQLRIATRSAENADKSWSTVPSVIHANVLLAAADADGNVPLTAATALGLWRDTAKGLTLAEVNREIARSYGALDRPLMFVTGKALPADAPAQALASLAASRAVAVARPSAQAGASFAYTEFGRSGLVVADRTVADLGIRTLTFANGVRLNLKPTEFETNIARWSLRIDGGMQALPAKDAAYATLMSAAFRTGGLVAHDYDTLQSLFSGSTASPGITAATDHYGGAGSVASEDLLDQMRLLAAYATAPGYRAEALAQFRRPLPEAFARLHATPGSALGVEMSRILAPGDPRFAFPEQAAMEALDFEQLRALISPALASGAIEIGLVGDFDEAEAIAAVAATLGALPKRALANQARDEVRDWPVKPAIFTIAHRGEPDQLAWSRLWPTTDDKDQKLTLTMEVLSQIFQLRLTDELREKLGATYGSSADSEMSPHWRGWGSFSVSAAGDVARLDEIEAAVERITAELRDEPVDADLFARAREPTLKAYATRLTKNGTWTAIVDEAQSRPDRLERFRKAEAVYRAITPAEVQAAARRFLTPTRAYTFRAVPAASPLAAGAVNRGALGASR